MARRPRTRPAAEQLDLVEAIAYAEPGAQLDLVVEAGTEVIGPRTIEVEPVDLALF